MTDNAKRGYDVIIVGAGPAGLCAAMYAGRGMLKALTIERGAPGGELLNTDLIEDYIGFESIKGWELAQKMAEHAKKFGAEIVTDTVEQIRKADDGWFDVATSRGKTYRAPAVILTAGGTPVKPGGPGEKEYAGKGVSYCAVCDGAFFKGEGLAEGGYFLTDDRMMPSIPGLFGAGDVRSQLTRQIPTAVGDATTAAIAVEKYLATLPD